MTALDPHMPTAGVFRSIRRRRSTSASASPTARFVRRFMRQRLAVLAAVVLLVIVVGAILAPWIATHDPDATALRNKLAPPLEGGHLLGTDHLGRDIFSRLLFGARVSMLAAVQGSGIGALIGVLPGFLAGYFGGKVDWVVMRATDALLSFPPIILAVAVIAALGPSLTNAMIAVGIVFSPRYVRIARSSVLAVRSETFIEAARSMGLSQSKIIRRHLLPHALSPLIVTFSVLCGLAMVVEASLSFLGLGVQPPQSTWGGMLSSSFSYVTSNPLLSVWPGLAIFLTVLCINVVGDGVRDSIGREVRRAP